MAIGTTAAIAAGAAGLSAIGGAIAGGSDKKTSGTSSNTSTQSSTSRSSIDIGGPSAFEQQAAKSLSSNFNTLGQYADLGPGASDITAGTTAGRELASLLQQYQQSGGAPSSQDIEQANRYATSQFAAQRLGIQQNQEDQLRQFQQQAAVQGRGGLDPIFRNKVTQETTRQQALLGAQEGAFANQFAQQLSQNRLGFANQRAGVLGGLASQAMANRQALFSMGNQIQDAERNFRLATATRTNENTQTSSSTQDSTNTRHGSVGDAIGGAFGGLGAGLSAGSSLGNLFGSVAGPSIGGAGAGAAGTSGFSGLNYAQSPSKFFGLKG